VPTGPDESFEAVVAVALDFDVFDGPSFEVENLDRIVDRTPYFVKKCREKAAQAGMQATIIAVFNSKML